MNTISKFFFNVVIVCFACILVISCQSKKGDGFEEKISTDVVESGQKNDGSGPEITFEKTAHDFGVIKEGAVVNFSFKFKNTGKSDLIVGDARGSCGCTVPKFPTHPIEPGDEGQIDVTFNSDGKHGKQHKNVTLVTNATPSTRVLEVIGEVTPAASN